jgi:hypothetical protein
MKSHILIFSDYRGNERFYLRVRGTIPEVQLWLERCTISSRPDAEWPASGGSRCSHEFRPEQLLKGKLRNCLFKAFEEF